MAIALVTNVKAAASNTATTPAADTTGATLLVLVVNDYSGAAVGTVSDSKGNTWTGLTARSGGQARAKVWYAKGPTVGPGHTVTYTTSGAFPAIELTAWSGVDTVAPFDLESGATNAGTTSIQPGSVTPSANGELVITGLTSEGPIGSVAVDSGFTISDSNPYGGGVNMGGWAAYKVQTTAAAVNPSWSWTTSTGVAATLATFKSSGGTTYSETGSGRLTATSNGPVAESINPVASGAAVIGAAGSPAASTGVAGSGQVVTTTTGPLSLAATPAPSGRVVVGGAGQDAMGGSNFSFTGTGRLTLQSEGPVSLHLSDVGSGGPGLGPAGFPFTVYSVPPSGGWSLFGSGVAVLLSTSFVPIRLVTVHVPGVAGSPATPSLRSTPASGPTVLGEL